MVGYLPQTAQVSCPEPPEWGRSAGPNVGRRPKSEHAASPWSENKMLGSSSCAILISDQATLPCTLSNEGYLRSTTLNESECSIVMRHTLSSRFAGLAALGNCSNAHHVRFRKRLFLHELRALVSCVAWRACGPRPVPFDDSFSTAAQHGNST